MSARTMALAALLLLVGAGAARAEDDVVAGRPAQAEASAAQAWSALQLGKGDDPRAQVRELVRAMTAAELGASADLALVHLGDPEKISNAAVRTAAREELISRAQAGQPLANELLLKVKLDEAEVRAHPALALKLGRARLEKALLERPLPEGGSFEAGDAPQGGTPPPQPAALEGAAKTALSQQSADDLAEARRILAAVPPGSELGTEAREVSGLAALAAGDEIAAEKEFGGLAGTEGRGQRALLQLARLAYARGDDRRAELLYARVGRGSSEWLDALFEASWSHFRKGEDERVLGNLLTLQAPFFKGREFPEGYVLQALVLYENCRYADARKALARLDAAFKPRHEALAAALGAVEKLTQPFDALAPDRGPAAAGLGAAARAELDRAAASPDLQASRAAVIRLGSELDSFDRRGDAIRASPLARALLPQVRTLRLELLTNAGSRLRARLAADRAELRELLGQSLRLSYEIAGREREQASSSATRARAKAAAPPEIDDDEVMWPFQGEYWRDELGSYRFTLGTRCVPAARFKARTSSAALER